MISKTTRSVPTGRSLTDQLEEARKVNSELYMRCIDQSKKIRLLEECLYRIGHSPIVENLVNAHGIALYKGYNMNLFTAQPRRELGNPEEPTTGCYTNILFDMKTEEYYIDPHAPYYKQVWVQFPEVGTAIQGSIDKLKKEE